jgi:CheY-like chemotaxis protein
MKENTAFNILLAEDDTNDRELFTEALKQIPIATNLITVNNGVELMDVLLKNSMNLPDVLFLDISMPRKTGIECLIEIKNDKKLDALPVVMFTISFTSLEVEMKMANTFLNLGAQDYIRKPINFEQFKGVIHQALIKVIEKNSSKDS